MDGLACMRLGVSKQKCVRGRVETKTGVAAAEMAEHGPRFCPGLSSMVRLLAISGDPMPQQKSASENK